MPTKAETPKTTDEIPMKALTQLQEAGLGNMMGLGTAWAEAFGDMSSEFASFVADRIKEDVKTQHEVLHCKSVGDLQQIQSQFVQKALEQYQSETGKLFEMSTKMFANVAKDKV
ncbi:MAG: phasin family protein [Silicimonas sp.]|nr:phasin family protein [Silicimonas sp.]